MFKKLFSFFIIFTLIVQGIPVNFFTVHAADTISPKIFFSDMISAPNHGWSTDEAKKGASVTVWGKGFGDVRGENFITVNGVNLTSESDYVTWGEIWPTDEYQKITFFLNDSIPNGLGEITVTIDGNESNSTEFTVREGNIYFVTTDGGSGDGTIANPYDDMQAGGASGFMRNATPGDVYYYRGGTYTDETNGGNALLWLRSTTDATGTEGMPISMIAYPGETPTFSIPVYNNGLYGGVSFDNNYMVFSGFEINSEYKGASLGGDYHRFIGNKIIGLKNYYNSGTGMITVGSSSTHTGNGTVVLGNDLSGGNSQNRFDHGIYVSGCAEFEGNYVGWNKISNNNFGRGAQIVVNHQQDRCAEGQILKSHYIFNNTISCDAQRGNAIGIFDLSYDEGEEEPEPTYVYNNISNGCGTYQGGDDLYHIGYSQVLSHSNGHAKFYNNTSYNSGYKGATFKSAYLLSTDFRNNIVHLNPDFPGPTGNIYIDHNGAENKMILSNNLFYGADPYEECDECIQDSDNLYIEPDFVDAAGGDFSLSEGSPLIGAGYSELPTLLSWAPLTKDMNLVDRGSSFDLGALQHISTPVILDTDAPIISNILPTGELSSDTTETTLSFNTDELATCKYSLSSDQTYSAMSDTFTTTGNIAHSQDITGLKNGNAYTYYVKCSDSSGNENNSDLEINFSIDEAVVIEEPKIITDPNVIPQLHFSDINSGPRTGNTDNSNGFTAEEHGAVVTIWGNGLGATQGESDVIFKDAVGVEHEIQNIYYWKNADGIQPSGPADLYSKQKMQEIAFSIPSEAADGNGEIFISKNSMKSSRLDFLVRPGNIYFVDNTGNDNADGSFDTPWQNLNTIVNPYQNKIQAGDVIYLLDYIQTTSVQIGSVAPYNLAGTEDSPYSLITYPGMYDNYISNVENPTADNRNVNYHSVIKNHYGENHFWNFSKLSLETNISGIHSFHKMRAIANEITGPDAEGTGGAITGGGHAGAGIKIYGNYVHDFGSIDTSNLHHIFYISNRTTATTEAYELSWNHLKDNGAPAGLHIFDQNGQGGNCGGGGEAGEGSWSGKFYINNNVVHNQRGCGFDYSGGCGYVGDFSADLDLSNNLFINDPDAEFTGSPICLNTSNLVADVNINNNIIYGFGSNTNTGSLGIAMTNYFSGTGHIYNNIIIDRSNQSEYANYVMPDNYGNNVFYSTIDPDKALPGWGDSNFNYDPLFVDPDNYDFTLQLESQCLDTGYAVGNKGAFGNIRPQLGGYDIGAYEYTEEYKNPEEPEEDPEQPEQGDPTTNKLVTKNDFEYIGGFTFHDTAGVSDLGFTNGKFAVDPITNSLYISSHPYQNALAQFSIPELKITEESSNLNKADILQEFKYFLSRVDNPEGHNQIGGLAMIANKLLVHSFEYYDAPADNQGTSSLYEDPLNLEGSIINGIMNFSGKAHIVSWTSLVPEEWQTLLGGDYIAGSSNSIPINSRSSMGPSGFTFNSQDVLSNTGSQENIQMNKLLDFSLAHILSKNDKGWDSYGAWDQYNSGGENDLWTEASGAEYGFIIPGTRTYATFGYSGMHETGGGYKIRQTEGKLCGGPCATSKYDYYNYYWLWDVNDLLLVKNGEKESYEVKPYEYGNFEVPYGDHQKLISGGSYDHVNKTLYLSLKNAYTKSAYNIYPVILGFKINNIIDTIVPVRTNILPTGKLEYGTTKANITLETNELSTCKYSTVSDREYSAMTGVFIEENSLTHSIQVTGLTDGGEYSYYIKCSDQNGNDNNIDSIVSFSVYTPPIIKKPKSSGGGGSSSRKKRIIKPEESIIIDSEEEKIYNQLFAGKTSKYSDKEYILKTLKNNIIKKSQGKLEVYNLTKSSKQIIIDKIRKKLVNENFDEIEQESINKSINELTLNLAVLETKNIDSNTKKIIKQNMKKNILQIREDYSTAYKIYKQKRIEKRKSLLLLEEKNKRIIKDKEYYKKKKALILNKFKK